MFNLSLDRTDKWIFQKNISSFEQVLQYVKILNDQQTAFDPNTLLHELSSSGHYQGRNSSGSINTMGVRYSQIKFYMFAYPRGETALLSPTSLLMLDRQEYKIPGLVNLMSIQYPHPFSETSSDFNIYPGRLLLELLLDKKLNQKLYIDEMIWFLPFIRTINTDKYNKLIDDILIFRTLKYEEKKLLFQSVENYETIFSNTLHEMKYYFIKLFVEMGVLEILPDPGHNEGNLFRFRHGDGDTFRNDSYKARAQCSGYINLNSNLCSTVSKLLKLFPFNARPIEKNKEVLTDEDLLSEMYINQQLKMLNIARSEESKRTYIIDVLNKMEYESRKSSLDGISFEESLVPVFELFDSIISVERIAGSGRPDLICHYQESGKIIKFNVEAKSRGSINSMNTTRVYRHVIEEKSSFALIIAPKFPNAVIEDINYFNNRLITVTAQLLREYCLYSYFIHNEAIPLAPLLKQTAEEGQYD